METESSTPPEFLALLSSALKATSPSTGRDITGPHGLASETLSRMFGGAVSSVRPELEKSAEAVSGGNLSGLEGTLASQAATLNAVFHLVTQHAFTGNRTPEEFDRYLRLAMRAQAQSAQAIEILSGMKQGPKVVVTQQLNAAGQQIVNNSPRQVERSSRIVRSAQNDFPSARARMLDITPSPTPDYAKVDTRSQSKTV